MEKNYSLLALFLLVMIACAKQPKEVHLYGSLKEFGQSEVDMELHGALSDFSDMGTIKIPVNPDGSFDIRFPLDKPTYFQIGRNTLYLTPGDDMKVCIGTSQSQTTFEGKGMEANTYLKKRLSPQEGSFLSTGRNIRPTYGATKAMVDSLAEIRKEELKNLQNVSAEFKRMEEMRIKADVINSYNCFSYYADGFLENMMKGVKSEEEAMACMRKYNASIAPDLNPVLKELSTSDDYLEIEVVRDMLLACMKEDFYDFPRSKALIELNDIFKKSYELKEGTLTKEKYNELCDFANGIENEKYKQAFLARLEQYSKFMEGNPAIDLELMKLDDSKGKLSDYKGKVMYIDFWATWCGPCMEEMPYFNELSIKYPNIQFIGISVYDDVKAWKNRISNGDYGNVIEVFSKDPKINSGWNVTGIPRFLLIDENFNIISSDAPRPSQKDKIEPLLEKYNNK